MNSPETINEKLQLGFSLHQAGKYDEAETVYKELLQHLPDNDTICYLLGTLLYQQHRFHEAKEKLLLVSKEMKDYHFVLNVLGLTNKALLHYNEAEQNYREALELSADYTEALNNLGVVYLEQGKAGEAIQVFSKLTKLEPESVDAKYNLGTALQNKGEYESALSYYDEVLEKEPRHYLALNNAGLIYLQRNNTVKAEQIFEKALDIFPEFVDALYNLANIYKDNEQFDDAEKLYKRALSLDDRFSKAYNNLGSLHSQQGEYEKAIQYFEKAVETDENSIELYINAGVAYQEIAQYDKALEYYNKALLINPKDPKARCARSEILLMLGDFEQGFIDYEYRLQQEGYEYKKYPYPMWNGENLSNKHILLYEEQGSGDTFMFLRYVQLLKQQGAKVTIECRNETAKIIKEQPYVDDILPIQDKNHFEGRFDFHLPLGSLCKIFYSKYPNDQITIPYINIYESDISKWEKKLRKIEGRKIGFAWAGNPEPKINRKRHIPLKLLSVLFEDGQTTFISLQKGFGSEQLHDYISNENVIELTEEIHSFLDTAAIIKLCDIIISVDTAVAHLAGAMGAKVLLLLPHVADWRWQQNKDETEWYPSANIFRQKETGKWNAVVDELQQYLKDSPNQKANEKGRNLTLALTSGENFGWGVCSKYLKQEVAKKRAVTLLGELPPDKKEISGTVFHAIMGVNMKPLNQVSGDTNVGYTFFENELLPESRENAKHYDLVLAGSGWCRDKLIEAGIENTDTLIQGIDPEIFYPIEEEKENDLFVIFSGGKFELRKGQDLVLKAFKIFNERHPDSVLINAWFNFWPKTIALMAQSPHITVEFKGEDYHQIMHHLYEINGLNTDSIITLPVVENRQLRELYKKTDVGLFPNRCEGGTNLVLMEYMACGKPVIASYSTGHKDVLTKDNSLHIQKAHDFILYEKSKQIVAKWDEFSVDQIVEQLEFAYNNREKIKTIGALGAETMKKFTWERTAEQLLERLDAYL